jgi:hypothetical protein
MPGFGLDFRPLLGIYMGEKGFIFKLVRVTIHCKWMPKSGLKSRPKPGIALRVQNPGLMPGCLVLAWILDRF